MFVLLNPGFPDPMALSESFRDSFKRHKSTIIFYSTKITALFQAVFL